MASDATGLRDYKGAAVASSLSSGISNASPTFPIGPVTNWPTGAGGNFTIVIDQGTSSEESILCASQVSGVITIVTRGYDGTTATLHAANAPVLHVPVALDFAEANQIANTHAMVSKVTPASLDEVPLFDSAVTFGLKKLTIGNFAAYLASLAQTLTNKILTAPVISTIVNTGTLTLPTATDTLVGRTTVDVLTNKDLSSVTNVLPTSGVTLTGIQTLTNKTITAPIIATITNAGTITIPSGTDTLTGRATTDTLTNKTVQAPLEVGQFLGAFGGAMNIDVTAGATQWFTSGGSSNPTFNFRGNSGATLNSLVSTGSMISVVIILAQGGTAYYPTAFTVDGVATAGVRWAGGIAPTAGNASANDVYTFTLWKTAGTPTWWIFAGVTKFA